MGSGAAQFQDPKPLRLFSIGKGNFYFAFSLPIVLNFHFLVKIIFYYFKEETFLCACLSAASRPLDYGN